MAGADANLALYRRQSVCLRIVAENVEEMIAGDVIVLVCRCYVLVMINAAFSSAKTNTCIRVNYFRIIDLFRSFSRQGRFQTQKLTYTKSLSA